jgi:AcrR family transcriptional regulator
VASRSQGQRAGLSRGLILDAAVALVDSEGPDGLSMRKLGAALGVEAMTLYHYVPNKAALLDGLVEWVLQHSVTAPALADGLSWDRMLRRYAETLRTTLLGHPGVLPLLFARPAVTPQTLKAVEDGLRVLSEAGFALPRALDMINVLSIFVVGHTMAEVGTADVSRRGDPGSAAALAQLEASDLPLVIETARLTQEADDESRFLFGLDALLCGFARQQEGKPRDSDGQAL